MKYLSPAYSTQLSTSLQLQTLFRSILTTLIIVLFASFVLSCITQEEPAQDQDILGPAATFTFCPEDQIVSITSDTEEVAISWQAPMAFADDPNQALPLTGELLLGTNVLLEHDVSTSPGVPTVNIVLGVGEYTVTYIPSNSVPSNPDSPVTPCTFNISVQTSSNISPTLNTPLTECNGDTLLEIAIIQQLFGIANWGAIPSIPSFNIPPFPVGVSVEEIRVEYVASRASSSPSSPPLDVERRFRDPSGVPIECDTEAIDISSARTPVLVEEPCPSEILISLYTSSTEDQTTLQEATAEINWLSPTDTGIQSRLINLDETVLATAINSLDPNEGDNFAATFENSLVTIDYNNNPASVLDNPASIVERCQVLFSTSINPPVNPPSSDPLFIFCPEDRVDFTQHNSDVALIVWPRPTAVSFDNSQNRLLTVDFSANIDLSQDNRRDINTRLLGRPGDTNTLVSLPIGEYDITYTVADAPSVTCEFSVQVFSRTGSSTLGSPEITGCPEPITEPSLPGRNGAFVSWSAINVEDPGDRDIVFYNASYRLLPTSDQNTLYVGFFINSLFGDASIAEPNGSFFFTDQIVSIRYFFEEPYRAIECNISITVTPNELPVFESCRRSETFPAPATSRTATLDWGNLTLQDTPDFRASTPLATVASTLASMSDTSTDTPTFTSSVEFVSNVFEASPPEGDPPPTLNAELTGGTFPIGESRMTFTFTDSDGNTALCTFSIVIRPTDMPEPPAYLYCPEGQIITIHASPSLLNREMVAVYIPIPRAVDAAGNPVNLTLEIDNEAFDLANFPPELPTGETSQISYMTTPSNGVTVPCSFTVVVESDFTPTVMGCPENIIIDAAPGETERLVTWDLPVFSDIEDSITLDPPIVTASSGIIISENPADGTTFPVGSSQLIQYQVTDSNSNSVFCHFTIAVNANNLRFTTCPEDITLERNADEQTAFFTWIDPTATDSSGVDTNIGIPVFTDATSNPNSPTVMTITDNRFPEGTTTVTYTVDEGDENIATCSFTVTVSPPPTPTLSIECPEDQNVPVQANQDTILVAWTTVTAMVDSTDQSSPIISIEPLNIDGVPDLSTNGGTFPQGISQVTFTATAGSESVTCSFFVTVARNDAPVIENCPRNREVTASLGVPDAIVLWTLVTAFDPDNNNPLIVTASLMTEGTQDSTGSTLNLGNNGGTFTIGEHTVTYTASDGTNTVSCEVRVTVRSNTRPVFVDCPADIIMEALSGERSAMISWTEPTIMDAEDFPNGNGEPNAEPNGDPNGRGVSGNPTIFILTSTDLSSVGQNGDHFPVGETRIRYTHIDTDNNFIFCKFSITITAPSNNPPSFADCPASLTERIPIAQIGNEILWPLPTASDLEDGPLQITAPPTFSNAAGPATISETTVNSAPLPVGSTTVTYTVIDSDGVRATCDIAITVEVDTPPVFTNCPDELTRLIAPPVDNLAINLETLSTTPTPTASDDTTANPTVTIETSAQPASAPNTYIFLEGVPTRVSYIASDSIGQTTVCSFDITVIRNNNPPIFTFCPDDISVTISLPDTPSQTVIWTLPVVYDQEDGAALRPAVMTMPDRGSDISNIYPISHGNFPIGETTLTYTATDSQEAQATENCSFTVTVNTNTSPVIANCPTDQVLELSGGSTSVTATWNTLTVTDTEEGNLPFDNNFDPGIFPPITPLVRNQNNMTTGEFPLGHHVIIYRVTDSDGNQTYCPFSITVIEADSNIFTIDLDNNTFLIEDEDDLQTLADILGDQAANPDVDADLYSTAHYRVTSNIALVSNLQPIGIQTPFRGTFDGDGKILSDIRYNNSNLRTVGLFAEADDATIKDLTLSNVNITNTYVPSGSSTEPLGTGSLVGFMEDTTLSNVRVTGTGTNMARSTLGGLIGSAFANNTITTATNSGISVRHLSNGDGYISSGIGGLIGALQNANTIDTAETSNISVIGEQRIGGLIGAVGNGNRIANSTADEVTVSGGTEEDEFTGRHIGGLMGEVQNSNTITSSSVGGTRAVSGTEFLGGLIASLGSSNAIIDSSASVTVSGTNTTTANHIGGLVGYAYSHNRIATSSAEGDVQVLTTGIGENIGGLLGTAAQHTIIEHSSATGTVSGAIRVGGLVGAIYDGATLAASFAEGAVTGREQVGGLIGLLQDQVNVNQPDAPSTLRALYAQGNVPATGTSVGGLIGRIVITGASPSESILEPQVQGIALYSSGSGRGGLIDQYIGPINGISITLSYFDNNANTGDSEANLGTGQSKKQLQTPMDYTGIYEDWNINTDIAPNGNIFPDNPWKFGQNGNTYPTLRGPNSDNNV